MDLNIPETRQAWLRRRLDRGAPVAAGDVARELGVSVDTIRRDVIALEAAGQARRVRGGAVPVKAPDAPMGAKIKRGDGPSQALVAATIARVGAAKTLLIDGGATALAVAQALRPTPGRLIMTPSPWVAVACNAQGIEVFVIGGALAPGGGAATGAEAARGLGAVAADIAVLGACGLDPVFGLSADHEGEARLKRWMAAAANTVIVPVPEAKLGQRARHKVLDLDEVGTVITDAPSVETGAYTALGLEVIHA